MVRLFKAFAISAVIPFLFACGGNEGESLDGVDPFGSGTITPGGSTAVTSTSSGVRIGSGFGSSFKQGSLLIGFGSNSISAGGSISISLTLLDKDGRLYTGSDASISFNSYCIASKTVIIDPPESPILAPNGVATITYTSDGCAGDDSITATVTIGDEKITATGTVNIQPATLGSIQFVSAEPEAIVLQGTTGTGLSKTSKIKFKVLNSSGGPVAGHSVQFALATEVGGLSVSPASAKTDAQGIVSTIVTSGTVPTVVSVIATAQSVENPGLTIVTESTKLSVSTGMPDQNSFSISTSELAPESWDINGKEVIISVQLGDRFNNPVPDGVAVYFTTEGGVIDPICLTQDGGCSVKWRSQSPRPCGEMLGLLSRSSKVEFVENCFFDAAPNSTANPNGPMPGFAPLGQPYGGRTTITARAVGEESFQDNNGNGVFDSGDTFQDIAEPLQDHNENYVYDFESDKFFDSNSDGRYSAGDNLYNGQLCEHPSQCSDRSSVDIFKSIVLVMADSTSYMTAIGADEETGDITVPAGKTTTIILLMSDIHHQPMPTGTELEFEVSGAITSNNTGKVLVPDSNKNYAMRLVATITADAESAGESGTLTIKSTTPGGLITTHYFNIIIGGGGITPPPSPGGGGGITPPPAPGGGGGGNGGGGGGLTPPAAP